MVKTASKRAIQIIGEETGDLVINKVADKVSKNVSQNISETNEKEISKERYTSRQQRQKIFDDLRLI